MKKSVQFTKVVKYLILAFVIVMHSENATCQVSIDNGYLYFKNQDQYLYGNGASQLGFYSNSWIADFKLFDREGSSLGSLYGYENANGKFFGLTDADGNFSYMAKTDKWTALRVNTENKILIYDNGHIDITGTRDANGSIGSGVLEIGNGMRLDSNEIITNTDMPLYLNRDNNGDIIMDSNTLRVDASTNRVGIGIASPLQKLHVDGDVQAGVFQADGSKYKFGADKYLVAEDESALTWRSNHSTFSQFILRDKEDTVYGRLYGNGNGVNFGLLDGDGHWSYIAVKDSHQSFRIDNDIKMTIQSNGRLGIGYTAPETKLEVKGTIRATHQDTRNKRTEIGFNNVSGFVNTVGDGGLWIKNNGNNLVQIKQNGQVNIPGTRDANGTPGSGMLEIGGNLRLDNNEIITNTNQALYINRDNNGNVIIGNVTAPSANYRLYVEKGILTENVRVAVKSTADWSDYVFEEDYEFMPISDLEDYVSENKHLPNVPCAADMVKDGLDVRSTAAILLEKIEEAHLYIIDLHQEIQELKAAMGQLKSK